MYHVAINVKLSFNIDYSALSKIVTQSFIDLGGNISKVLSNKSRVSVIMGTGTLGLNPIIIHAYIKETASGSELDLHALSKEGLINQFTSKKALSKFTEYLDEKIT